MENIDKLKLLLFAFSPVIISKLFSHVLWVGMEISFLSILFCIYWYYVGYKSYDYSESVRESILLGNSFAILSIILMLFQIAIMDGYMFNIIGTIPQIFYLPMVRVSSWINSFILLFVRYTTNSLIIDIISFVLMIILYSSGYHLAKTFNEGK